MFNDKQFEILDRDLTRQFKIRSPEGIFQKKYEAHIHDIDFLACCGMLKIPFVSAPCPFQILAHAALYNNIIVTSVS